MNIAPPTIIDAPGEYETRKGERVLITSIGTRHPLRQYARLDCFGSYQDGTVDAWTHQGFIWRSQNCDNDIVKKIWQARFLVYSPLWVHHANRKITLNMLTVWPTFCRGILLSCGLEPQEADEFYNVLRFWISTLSTVSWQIRAGWMERTFWIHIKL